jgi:nicotinamide mononucleotide adenylyltransferase/ubiquinone/menaquinone biosynthesis C-methylase UbiE
MIALLVGRFHAVTAGQSAWLESLSSAPVDRLVCVVTSANHAGTRRNPLPVATREELLRPALARSQKPFDVVRIDDVPESSSWVEYVCQAVNHSLQVKLEPRHTQLYSANRDVCGLFEAKGFTVIAPQVQGLTPHELVQRIIEQRPWQGFASPETQVVYSRPGVVETLRSFFGQTLVNDDGELGHQRDFASYGAQMDASLLQKLADMARWVKPGCIVDKGCGTGQVMVELSRLFPTSRLVGVDLSREFLRRCDENTYATQEVDLVFGNVTEVAVPPGAASTVVFSSVMHEVHSYNGYQTRFIDQALRSACTELQLGGHVIIRDGLSPPPAVWQLELLTPAAQTAFARFAAEFRHGQGAPFTQLGPHRVQLTSHLANEFICKKDYQANWHIEVNEEFGALTLDGWQEALRRTGFEPLHLQSVVNPWIVKHRYEGQVRLFDTAGVPLAWPATNGVVIGRKPKVP